MITQYQYSEKFKGGLMTRSVIVWLLFGFIPLYKRVVEYKG